MLLPAIALGLLIAVRRPHARIAPVLCLTGAVPLVIGFGDLYGAAVAAHPGVLPVSGVLVGLSSGSWMLLYVPAAFVLLLFPDGRLPGPRWRVVAIGLLVVPAAFATLGMLDPDGLRRALPGRPAAVRARARLARARRLRACCRCSWPCSSPRRRR